MHPPPFQADVDLQSEARGAVCLEKLMASLRAIPASDVVQVNLDITSLCAAVVGAAANIRPLRDRAARIEEFDPRCIDRLEPCAFALSYIDGQCTSTVKSRDDLADLYREGVETRKRFHADATNLCVNGVADPSSLQGYTARTGYKVLIDDLRLLLGFHTVQRDAIRGKTLRTPEELDRAEALVNRIVRLIGLREQSPAKVEDWADLRRRAYTLLVNDYNECRRVVAFVRRHEGDADTIAPSLFAARGKRKPKENDDASPPAHAAAPPATPTPATSEPEGGPFLH